MPNEISHTSIGRIHFEFKDCWVVRSNFIQSLLKFKAYKQTAQNLIRQCVLLHLITFYNIYCLIRWKIALNGLTLKVSITTKVVCFDLPIGAFRSGSMLPTSLLFDFLNSFRQLFAADDISRRHFQMYFFLTL